MVTYANMVSLIVAVLFGILALNEPLPQSWAGLAGRALSVCLLGAGSLLLQDGAHRRGIPHGVHELKAGSFTSPHGHLRSLGRSDGSSAVGGGYSGTPQKKDDAVMMDAVQVLTALDPKHV